VRVTSALLVAGMSRGEHPPEKPTRLPLLFAIDRKLGNSQSYQSGIVS
jgi:hypothetical protein